MCFVWIWEQTAIISLYSINWLVFITETECIYCAVRTGSLYIRINLEFLRWMTSLQITVTYPPGPSQSIRTSPPPNQCLVPKLQGLIFHAQLEYIQVCACDGERAFETWTSFTNYIILQSSVSSTDTKCSSTNHHLNSFTANRMFSTVFTTARPCSESSAHRVQHFTHYDSTALHKSPWQVATS